MQEVLEWPSLLRCNLGFVLFRNGDCEVVEVSF